MKRYFAFILLVAVLPPKTVLAGPQPTNPVAPWPDWVVTNSIPATNEITFKEFLNEVAQANLDYAAQRYNVDIAKAAVAIAKEFPNPTLSLGASRDLRFHGEYLADSSGHLVNQTQPEARSVGLDQTIEYFGKRKWRVRTADQAYRSTAASVEDFLRNLKLNAAEAYALALATQRTLEQQRKTTDYLTQLVAAQRLRLKGGDIGETDLAQSRVGELQSQSDLLNAQNDAETAQLALSTFLGRNRGQTRFLLRGKLELEPRRFDLGQLLTSALLNRPDLIALRHARDSAQSGLRLAQANRMPDVDVGLSYDYTSQSHNFVDPAPADSQLALTFSVPLPLWNRRRAEIQTARFAADQAETTLQSAELKTEVQIRQAFTTYQLVQARLQKFEGEILKGAEDVLTAKRFAYEHGNATLLDLLAAQSADNEVHQAYNGALADAATALMELERAAGLWDVEF
jgi:cobalt-zinc-cadmium efflux system outer membrane protein